MNNKFDMVFEKTMRSLTEKEYAESSFEDNLRMLIKILRDNDYLDANKNVDHYLQILAKQPNEVKELQLASNDQTLPPIKIKAKQAESSGGFSVSVINVQSPDQQKSFENSMLETIFADVIEYIKMMSLENIRPESAIDAMPAETGANSQPGNTQSELPTNEPQATA